MSKSPITCHVLDSSTGRPAQGVMVRLQEHSPPKYEQGPETFDPLGWGVTNSDGRCLDLLAPKDPNDGPVKLVEGRTYKIIFRTKEYFEQTNRKCFYPWVEVVFTVENPDEHYHIPLLISPYAYNTYRGS